MLTIDHKIKTKNGLHARPAGQITKFASELTSSNIKIQFKKKDKIICADAKNLFDIMKLCAKKGDVITFYIENDKYKVSQDEIKIKFEEFLNEKV